MRERAARVRVKLNFKNNGKREQHEISERISQPDYHRVGVEGLKADRQRVEVIEHELAQKFERWSELEQRANANA